jgi:hypothetical protein
MTEAWKSLHYLRTGSPRQQRAYATLEASNIWRLLSQFNPVLAGTVPLGIDIASSDLDVLCEVPAVAQEAFSELLRAHFGARPGFRMAQRRIGGHATTVASFRYEAEEIEVFGQALPTAQQHGWRHLLVERAILVAGGPAWRTAVRAIKQQGFKTEPAFAQLLGLPGDPYAALLTLENASAEELHRRVAACVLPSPTDIERTKSH